MSACVNFLITTLPQSKPEIEQINVTRLTSYVTSGSWWHHVVCQRKAGRGYTIIYVSWPRKLYESNVVVCASAVVVGMLDNPRCSDILFSALVSVSVVISEPDDII